MSSIVECLLALKDNVATQLGGHISNSTAKTPIRRKLELRETDGPVLSVATPGKRYPKSQQRSPLLSGQKINEVVQFKHGTYTDLPAAKISEMLHSNSLDVKSLA
jgi:kinesin family protein C2/C3